ncbi:uncharacterized protein LOC122613955 [Drosophila teissieri]|uniref:uncharacterized protein LOC122613955 n=1 Tax=Drosophila teissieri TaxID=7243 RepID=UPI001CBA1576|nr:uncharacterized protein LOC122613955 [Drosophila teissieri]
MYNWIQGLHLNECQRENEGNTGKLACEGTVKLNANAQEFVPRFKREDSPKHDAIVGNRNINNAFNEGQKIRTNLMLPWKGFPNKSEKPSRGPQVALLNDADYIGLPCTKRLKKPTEDKLHVENVPTTSTKVYLNTPAPAGNRFDNEEKRREHERKVALEALKLTEQRRMRDPLVTPMEGNENSKDVRPIINLSRSPIRFTPEERIRVTRLKAAKRERIERILREMTNGKQTLDKLDEQELQQDKISFDNESEEPIKPKEPYEPHKHSEKKDEVPVVTKKRYIPTTKEWDEQCRAKQLAKMEAQKQSPRGVQEDSPAPSSEYPVGDSSKQPSIKANVVNITPWGVIRLGDLRATTQPRYCPPAELLDAEKRRGNLTHFRPLPNWTIRRSPQVPLKILLNQRGKIVQRYSIDQLLVLEPQPEELEEPRVDEALLGLGFLCDSFRRAP